MNKEAFKFGSACCHPRAPVRPVNFSVLHFFIRWWYRLTKFPEFYACQKTVFGYRPAHLFSPVALRHIYFKQIQSVNTLESRTSWSKCPVRAVPIPTQPHMPAFTHTRIHNHPHLLKHEAFHFPMHFPVHGL